MNFVAKFDSKLHVDGSGAHSGAHHHVDSISTHAPSDAIIVPDADLLFNGDFKRSGVDLIVSRDDHELVVQDYFKGEKRAALASPDGAHLTGDIVNALAGHVEYAQADGSASAGKVIGHVTKLVGSATAIRNGVSIILHQGDNVEKGDVVQSGSGSTLGVTFIDGTVFGLSSNARMVLNEMVYDPNGSNNSSLISLVAGTISFVAGQTAKHGDMKIDTPVATMGIRGTAVLVEIDFDVPGQNGMPEAKFQVLVEPDGTTGSYILFDKNTLAPIAVVDKAGQQVNISNNNVSITDSPLSPELQKLITDVFTLKFSNTNPQTLTHFTDTLIPQTLAPIKLADGTTATPVVLIVNPINPIGQTPSLGHSGPINTVPHLNVPPHIAAVGSSLNALPDTAGSSAIDTASGKISFADINPGDLPTAKATFNSFTYQNAQHHDVTATLNAQQLADIHALEVPLVVVQTPGNNNNGTATWTYNISNTAVEFLSAGETLTLTYMAEVDSNYAQGNLASFIPFTITITGTNDAPVITTGAPKIGFTGGINTPGGYLSAKVPTSGTLSFVDVNLDDTHTVATKLASAVLSGSGVAPGTSVPPGPLQIFETALTAKIAADSTGTGNGTIDWNLASLPVYLADFVPKGDTLTLTYAVTVTDSQHATSTQDVTVTITGNDHPAVVWIDTGAGSGGSWSDASNWETGTVPTATDDVIIITDQLIGLTPSYPVTINAPAAAHSLTMNDYGTHSPTLINKSTLTVGAGGISLNADAILENFGLLKLAQGGDFKDQSTVTNFSSGTIEVAGGTLDVLVDIANSGHVTIDPNATLKLNGASINGGTTTNNGIIDLAGNAVLENGTLGSSGPINVSGTGNALVNESVDNSGITVFYPDGQIGVPVVTVNSEATFTGASTDLTITVIDPEITFSTITIADASTLTLNGATIRGGSITDNGIIEVTGDSTIDNAMVNGGQVTVDAGTTLTLSSTELYGGAITNAGIIEIAGNSDIINNMLGNAHLTVDVGVTLTLDGTTVTGGTVTNNGTVKVDADETLTLNGATISGGTLTNGGTLNSTGTSAITDAAVTIATGGTVEATTGKLTISSVSISNAGLLEANGGTLEIDGSSAPAPFFADNFKADTGLNPGWTVVSPNPASSVQLVPGTGLEVTASYLNGGSDLFGGSNLNAPVVLHSIDPTLNWTIETKLDFSPTDNYQGTGILLATTTSPFTSTDQFNRIAERAFYPNGGGDIVEGAGGSASYLASSIYLEVTKAGDLYTSSFSSDGIHWTVLGTETTATAYDEIGLFTLRQPWDGAPVSSQADFKSFDVTLTPPATLTNAGTLKATGDSTLILNDEIVSNATGTIQVDAGSTLDLESTTITGGTVGNSGVLDSTGDNFITGATIVNSSHIDVVGGTLTIDPAPVTNTGTIEVKGDSILVLSGETFTNSVTNGGVTKDGLIQVDATDATHFATLDLDGSTIDGGTVTISGVLVSSGDSFITGAHVTNTGIIDVAAGALAFDAASVLDNSGMTKVDSGATLTIQGSVDNSDTLETDGGMLVIGADAVISGTAPAVTIANGGTADFVGTGQPLALNATFSGAGTLELDDSQHYGGAITGFNANDKIDLADLAYSTSETDVWNSANDTLTINSGTHIATLNFGSGYNQNSFSLISDANGDTEVVSNSPAVSFIPAYLTFNGNNYASGPVATTQVGDGANDGVTLAGWVNWTGQSNSGNHGQVLFYNGSTSDAGSGVLGSVTANGLDLQILVGGITVADTGVTLSAGQWYDVALTHVNGDFTLYVDGVADYTFQAGANNMPGPAYYLDSMLIGGDAGGEDFVGSIGDVSVWNTALTQSDVQALEFTSLSGSETGLAAYYPLSDGSGATAADLVNEAGSLSLSGSPTWVTNGVTTDANTALTLKGLTVTDPGSDIIDVTLDAGHGTLSLANAAGVTESGTGATGSPLILTGTLAAIDTALGSGVVYTPSSDFAGIDTLSVEANDGAFHSNTVNVAINVAPPATPTVTITVDTPNGLDFQHHHTLVEMGSGIIQSGGSPTSFTIVDSADNLEFVLDGCNFTYGNGESGITVTGGTLTSFHEFTADATPVALADFTGLSIDAVTWMSDVQQAAAGDHSAIDALTSTFAYNFVGSPGPDTFGSAGHADTLSGTGVDVFDGGGAPSGGHDTLTGGAGSTFVFTQGYGALTITNFDQANGTFDASESDQIQLNGLTAPLNVSYASGNAMLDFGNGDVVTLLHVTQSEYEALGGTEFSTGGSGENGNNNGPVISNAGNTVTYTGTPVVLDPSIAVSDNDATAAVTGVNAWISAGAQTGDALTINGTEDGTITDSSDGSIIHYHFDGNAIDLEEGSGSSGTPTLADFDAALQLIEFSPGAADGARTVTWAAHDDASATSSTVTTTVEVGPTLNSFTLTVSEGSSTVLTTADFDVTHPQSSDFFSMPLNSVTGGEFEVTQDGGVTWPSAPTGGFTIAQIEAGDVRFTPDDSAIVPDFPITVSDGIGNVSPAIAPMVSLEIAGATAETITFAGSSGILQLDNPSSFTGEIAGISGAGDMLDMHGFAAATTSAVTGSGSYDCDSNTTTLTVTDSSSSHPQSETFKLAGDYSTSSWTVTDDHNGGVDIVDPPAPANMAVVPVAVTDPAQAATSTIVASAPNQILTGHAVSDTFAFNFTGVGDTTVTDFHPATDTLQFSSPLFANVQAALNATHDDGHGNTVIALDAHDTITLSGIVKAQLHASDFHFV